MKYDEIVEMLEQLGVPVEHECFDEENPEDIPDFPYIIFTLPGDNNVFADGIVFVSFAQLRVELYNSKRDIELEKRLEDILGKHEIGYQKAAVYLQDEKMYETYYEMEV